MKDDKDFERTRMGEYGLDINVEKHYRDIVAFILGVNTNWMEMEKKIFLLGQRTILLVVMKRERW